MDEPRSLRSEARQDRECASLPVRLALASVFIALCTACSACEKERKTVTPTVSPQEEGVVCFSMGGVDVALEVADDDSKRMQGLKQRRNLEENRGMIFLYPEPRVMSFWMEDTPLPLSIAFLREDGTIMNIEKMAPMVRSPSYLSKGLCRFAIEMNQGWFERHGINPGDRIALPKEILDHPAK